MRPTVLKSGLRRSSLNTAPWIVALSALTTLASGCRCDDDRPYTPFQVASALPSTTDSAPAPPASNHAPTVADAGGFAPRKAELAPSGARVWAVETKSLRAPAGQIFERALSADFDRDGSREVVAWLVPEKPSIDRPPGELWLYQSSGAPRKLLGLPGFVPTGPNCTLTPKLQQTGPQSVTLDVASRCDMDLMNRAPVRALLVVSPLDNKPLKLGLRVAEPAPGETLELAVDSVDRDSDGRDDIYLKVRVSKKGSRDPVEAPFVFFDRTAGLSRDAGEPGNSMARFASTQLVRAKGRTSSERAAAGIGNLKRFFASVCGESGTARIFEFEGAPLNCGSLKVTFSRARRAELRAALGQANILGAFGAFFRRNWFGKSTEKERDELARELEKAVTTAPASATRFAETRVPASGNAPRFGPLRFTGDGQLLVRTQARVVEVDPSTGKEQASEIDAGAEPPYALWPLEITRAGQQFIGAIHACDHSEVLLSFSEGGGLGRTSRPTHLIAARPGPCAGGRGPELAAQTALGWKDGVLSALVAGEIAGPPLAQLNKGVPPGSPRSPDGQWLIVATELGLLVTGPRHELWKLSDAAGITSAGRLRDCTLSPGARRAACTQGTRVVIIDRP